MNKAANNEKFDSDILQCKADIVRARNTISLENDADTANSEPQNNTKEEMPINEVSPPPVSRKEEAETSEKTPEIPSFDLAEEIMAEQRKITAIRRKAPGKKNAVERLKPKVQSADHITEQPRSSLSEQDKIIAEIVARDIERLRQR